MSPDLQVQAADPVLLPGDREGRRERSPSSRRSRTSPCSTTYIETTSLAPGPERGAGDARRRSTRRSTPRSEPRRRRLLKEADAAAEAEIKSKNAHRPEGDRAGQVAATAARDGQDPPEEGQLAPKHFDAVREGDGRQGDRHGSVRSHVAAAATMRHGRRGQMKRKFLMANPTIRNMDAGQITQVMTDAGTRTPLHRAEWRRRPSPTTRRCPTATCSRSRPRPSGRARTSRSSASSTPTSRGAAT